jgi:hypothetical protein
LRLSAVDSLSISSTIRRILYQSGPPGLFVIPPHSLEPDSIYAMVDLPSVTQLGYSNALNSKPVQCIKERVPVDCIVLWQLRL